MNTKSVGLQTLASPAFIGALALLVLNDFAFKPLFHNWLTGKISDFAGLCALAIFCAAFWPKYRWIIGVTLAAAFTFWKSGSSEPVIGWLNSFAPFPVGRTVDPTDLLALPSIWLGLWAVHRVRPWPLPRAAQVALALLAPIAFTATSSYSYVRQTTMQTSEPGAAAGPDEAAVQAVFDEIAREEGMPPCRVCDPIAEGRVYYDGEKWLTANFDAATEKVYFQVLGGSGRSGAKNGDRFVVEIVATLSERFPDLDVVADTVGRDAEKQRLGWPVSFTVHLAAETLDVAAAESAKRTLSQIIEETVRAHGLKLDSNSLVYYAGKRVSHTAEDRELALTASYPDHATLTIWIRRHSDEYEALQRSMALDLEERLDAAFGADRVAVFRPTVD